MSELIAEARVLVTPDTTQFRTLLTTQLAAATKGVIVPVQVTPVVSSTAASSQAAQIAGANAAAQSAQRITSSSAAAAQAQQQLARAADLVAVAERRAAAATSEVSVAQIRYRAQISATAATFSAYQKALQSSDLLLIKQTRDAFAAAKANEALALSNLNVTRTESAKTAALTKGASAQAASFRQISTGAGSAGAALLGVRGATLAATGPFLAGAAGAIALSKSIQLATSFNSEIAVLGATVGATGEQLTQAAEAARGFGRDITLPGVTAGDAAKTITEFAKAGLDLNDSIAATRGGLQLAQAAQLSYEDAVTLTANALNAFELSGNQAVRVADTLANASNLAQGGIGDMALALRQAAGAAAVVGVSFEDTTALLTLLAQNGLTGSDAGTALRTAFLRLVNPSKEAKEILGDLNVQLRDLNGNVRPEVFAEFSAAQRDLSAAQQQANAAIVFGQDAFRAFGFLGREGTKGLKDVQTGLEQTGTAARIAQARMAGLAGAQENLSNQLSALGETIGQIATPPLTFFVDELARFVGAGNDAVGAIKEIGAAFADIEFPERPPGVDRAAGIFGNVFGEVFKTGNIVGQALRVRDLLSSSNDQIEDEIKNGGVELRDALESAAREASRGAVSFADQITGALDDAFALIRSTLAQAQRNVRSEAIRATAGGAGQQAGLEEVFDQLLAGGASAQQQIASLRRQAEVQAGIIEDAGPDAAGVLLERRRAAQAKLAQINQQIVGLEKQIAADAKAASDEAQRIRDDAKRERDRAFLLSQEDARTAAERRVTLAEDTPELQDDIRRQTELRALIKRQIRALLDSAVEERAKQSAVRALKAERDKTTDAIKELRKADQDAKEAARDERLDAQAAFAESVFDLTGNKNPLLRSINAQIKEAQEDARAAKKGTTEWLKARTEINRLLKQRKDLLEETEETGGKSLAQFLTENAELFKDFASNIGTVGVDPFSGFDFSKSIVATTTKLQQAVKAQQPPSQAQANRVPDAIDRLIAALERNTEATAGNTATSGAGVNGKYAQVTGQRAQAQADFWQAQQARNMEQARFDGGGGI